MGHKVEWIEVRKGRPVKVRGNPDHKSYREAYDDEGLRADALDAENASLQHRLSVAQSNEHTWKNNYTIVANEHGRCRHLQAEDANEIADLRDRNEKLVEKVRSLRRSSQDVGDLRRENENLRAEVEILRREIRLRNDLIRDSNERSALDQRRIAEKDSKIVSLKSYIARRIGVYLD